MGPTLRWDVFCRVVDNFGDIGVCWRLATQLAARGQRVDLWVDDPAALDWMAPDGCAGVQVHVGAPQEVGYQPADVLIDAFGAGLPESVVAAVARRNTAGGQPRIVWINLEYLSAQAYVESSHGLASPVHGGAAAGVHKWFFFPGFTSGSGGLLREAELAQRQAGFDAASWRARWQIATDAPRVISLFCYEPAALAPWLQYLAAPEQPPTCLLLTHGRPGAAVRAAVDRLPAQWNAHGRLRMTQLPPLTQTDFDHLLWSCDVNFVRGEDTLVRALWAGKPFVWQAYPQAEAAHEDKLDALLDVLQAPASWRQFHHWWNGAAGGAVPAMDTRSWGAALAAARGRLLAQDDLLTRLLRFVAENR